MAKIIQDADKPVEKEILAEAIIKASDALTKLLSSGLNKRAIILLVSADAGVGRNAVECVLDSLADLKRTYCR